jgi:hypothetical protein
MSHDCLFQMARATLIQAHNLRTKCVPVFLMVETDSTGIKLCQAVFTNVTSNSQVTDHCLQLGEPVVNGPARSEVLPAKGAEVAKMPGGAERRRAFVG